MHMNRTFRALTVAAVLLAAAAPACTDLTVEPKSDATSTNVFRDPSSYRAFLARLYAGLAVSGQQGAAGNPDIEGIDEGFSQYLRLYWEAQTLPTDEAVIGWGDVGLPEMNQQTWAVSNVFVISMYARIFYQIVLANEFLRQTTDAQLDARGNVSTALRAEIQTYRAEARFLRALSYWHGIDLFGAIPLITEADVVGVPPAQATRTQVYDFIVSELNAIMAALPPNGAASYGRATPAAAHMLLAKVYLNAEVYTGTPQFTLARTEAEAVIAAGFTLDNNYQDMFLADNNTSPEIIFAVTQDGLRTQTWGGMTFLVHASCGGSMSASASGIDGCWWGLRLKQQAYNLFNATADHPAGDTRDDYFYTSGQNVNVTSIGNFNDGIAAPKFRNRTSAGAAGSHPTHVDTDFPMFRLADAYLIYAEANLRGGGGSAATALGYVNALRNRAYGGTAGDITAGQLTLSFILDERLRELLWEGHRRSDLIRYGLFTGGTYLWAWKGGVAAGQATLPRYNLYPLPESELVANPNLCQNPGYGGPATRRDGTPCP
jgi:hypothetical protein